MHNVKFKKLTFKNFMSYGNNVNTFTFTDGLIWFAADNGFGKSTIVEALNFVLFGDSYRGGNKGDLRNTRNPTCDLEVSLEFSVDTFGTDEVAPDEYRIFRTMKPSGTSKFDVEKLENGKWIPQNKRAGFSQKDFEELIIGFNEVLFKNVIAMNTQETVPFIQMPAAKKRELLESIIAMSLDSWKKENSKRMSTATIDFDVANADYSRLGNEINELNNIIARMEDERKGNVNQLKNELASIDASIADVTNRITAKNEEITLQSGVVNGLSSKCQNEMSLKSRLAALGTVTDAIRVYDDLLDDYNDAKANYDEAAAKVDPNLDEYRNSRNTINSDLSAVKVSIPTYERSIAKLDWNITNVKSQQDELTRNANDMKPGVPCPTCGKPSTEADVEVHKTELRNKWKALNKQLTTMKADLVTKTEKLEQATLESADLQKQLDELDGKITLATTYINETVNPLQHLMTSAKSKLDACVSKMNSAGTTDPEEISNEVQSINNELSEIAEARQQLLTEQTKLTTLNGDLRVLNTELGSYRERMGSVNAELDRLENAQNDDALGAARTRLENAIAERESAHSRMSEKSDTIEICKYIAEMCSDGGMKKMIFGLFVPAFNAAVKKNIIQANLPFTITFDDTMDFTFKSAPGDSPTYTMCSQGQKRKIGFAISMAFRDFVSLVGNFKINFLSLDEVLDISTDDNAMRAMLDLVKEMVDDIGCAAVITHRGPVVADKFDYKITITHNGAYSSIGTLQKM